MCVLFTCSLIMFPEGLENIIFSKIDIIMKVSGIEQISNTHWRGEFFYSYSLLAIDACEIKMVSVFARYGTCWDFGGQVTDLHKRGDMKSGYGHWVKMLTTVAVRQSDPRRSVELYSPFHFSWTFIAFKWFYCFSANYYIISKVRVSNNPGNHKWYWCSLVLEYFLS